MIKICTNKRRRQAQAVAATVAAISSFVFSANARAQTLIFDDMSGFETGATGASATYYSGAGDSVMGGYYSLPAGTTSLTGFDVLCVNSTGATVPDLQIDIYVWGSVNTTGINSSNPAYSNLLGSYAVDVATNLPTGYYTVFQTGEPGTTPGITLGTPLNLPTGTSVIGLSYGFKSSSTIGGTYAAVTGLTTYASYGVQPTTDLSGTFYPFFFYNTGGETNGNFNEGPYTFKLTDNEMAARIFGNVTTTSGSVSWAQAFSGDWNTASNWTTNTIPISTIDAIFNLSSPGYTVTVSQANAAKDVYVINDTVVLDLNQAASSLTISGALSVGVPTTSGTFTIGNLGLTHSFGGASANFSAASAVVGANGGTGILTVGSGVNLVIAGNTAIGAGSQLTVAPGGRLYTSSLSLAGTTGAWTGLLDLGTSQLDLSGNTLATVNNMVAQGYAGGTWQGSGGITSSVAASDTAHLTAVGVISNNVSGSALYGSSTAKGLFGGQSPGLNDVLVKYTYYGDANLDGKVDGSDYSIIDNTYLHENFSNGVATNPISGWYNGDFNYDGVVDGSDYALMDNAFNQQGTEAVNPDALIGNNPDGVTILDPSAGEPKLWSTLSVNAGPNLLGNASPTASVGTTVPEPTGLALLSLAAMGSLRRRGRIVRA